ncbi:hypothetical protein JOF56_009878 [Kibdelosporangium banguiense]|uniref:Uncharacterized protein n=1 Tax=Kibdelosporangium banguiense TaxID=1365924 RepID=A0ABS4TYM3_9PSEU|nr:hypothetical protein [Kibdelosporangium banguiense]MBP2329493.1 hypothetical protein [Kibdelosporangium banguiense]
MLPDLRVVSFVNYLSTNGVDLRHAAAEEARAQFGGTAAPVLSLILTETDATAILGHDDRP